MNDIVSKRRDALHKILYPDPALSFTTPQLVVKRILGSSQRRLFTARKAFWSQTGSARHLPLELELCTSLLCFVEREIIQVE